MPAHDDWESFATAAQAMIDTAPERVSVCCACAAPEGARLSLCSRRALCALTPVRLSPLISFLFLRPSAGAAGDKVPRVRRRRIVSALRAGGTGGGRFERERERERERRRRERERVPACVGG